MHRGRMVNWSWHPPVLNGWWLFILELWVISYMCTATARLKFLTLLIHSLCNLYGSVIKINWVACQNSVSPCVEGHTDWCLCMRQITTCKYGLRVNYMFGFREFILPIHYTIFMGLHWWYKSYLCASMSRVKAVIGEKFRSPIENGCKMTKVIKQKVVFILNFGFMSPKRPCMEPGCFLYFASKSVLAVGERKNRPKNERKQWSKQAVCKVIHMWETNP